MKRTNIISATLAAFALVSCVDLDTAPYNSIAQGNFWQTEEDAKKAVMGVYAQLKNQGAFGYMPLWDTYSDIAHGPASPLEVGTYTANEAFLVQNWQDSWDGVHRANTVIKNVSGMDIDQTAKNNILGEAYFLRALYYFHLTDFFGSVPLYDETWDVSEKFMDMLLPRNTAEECWKFIKDDCTRAIGLLPLNWDSANYGRATIGSAYALRGKAHLYCKEWKEAIADFEEIVYNKTNNYGYALYDDYNALFQTAGPIPGNHEEVFTIQNLGNVGALYGMEFPMIYGSRGTYGSGRTTCMPSVKLADMYEWQDGRPFDWNDMIPGFNESARKFALTLIQYRDEIKELEEFLGPDLLTTPGVKQLTVGHTGMAITPTLKYWIDKMNYDITDGAVCDLLLVSDLSRTSRKLERAKKHNVPYFDERGMLSELMKRYYYKVAAQIAAKRNKPQTAIIPVWN